MNTPGTMTKIGAATQILRGIGAPINQHTVGAMVGWFNAEGGNWANNASYNPLNTTLTVPGARSINSAGVKAYGNWNQGIAATVQTLKQGNMAGIRQAFHSSDPQAVIHAIGSSPWGTSGDTVAQTIGAATGQRYQLPNARGIAAQMAQGRTNGLSTPGVSNTGPTSSIDMQGALAQSLLNESATPPPENGTVKVSNPLGDAINLINSGQFTRSSSAKTALTAAPSGIKAAAQARAGANVPGRGDINPLQHFTLGRTDMGVDASAKPGTAILAPNDAKVVGVTSNWFKGQPYVALQLLSGPNKGKVMYVAEQIDHIPRVGQIIQRGSPIALYAPTGTGIEAGWANPNNWQQTLAQATTGYSEGEVTRAGQAFRNFLG